MFERELAIVCAEDRDGDGAAHIVAKVLNWDGTTAISEITISTGLAPRSDSGTRYFTANHPDVAFSANGDLVVVWQDDRDGNGKWQIYARGYRADGTEKFGEMTVNSVASGQQLVPAVASAANGDFIVVWDDDKNENGKYQIYARGFNANGTEKFHDMTVNSVASGQRSAPDVGMAANGDFVVAWDEAKDGNEIYARGFHANGSEKFHDFRVNPNQAKYQYFALVSVGPEGEFAVVWCHDPYSSPGDSQNPEVWLRTFHPDGSVFYPGANIEYSDNTGEWINARKVFRGLRLFRPAVDTVNNPVGLQALWVREFLSMLERWERRARYTLRYTSPRRHGRLETAVLRMLHVATVGW